MLPNFLGIGAQRAATTWIYECLREHPEVYMASIKEVHYFDTYYDRGLEWYEGHFEAADNDKVVGEISPNYLHSKEAMQRIKELLPDVKLLISLRNPAERAFSAYTLYNEQFKGVSFEDAFKVSAHLRDVGLYYEQLKHIYEIFSREQCHVVFYDDISDTPEKVVEGIYEFLCVDKAFRPAAVTKVYNKIILPRLQNNLNYLGMGSALDYLKKTGAGEWLKKYLVKKDQKLKNEDTSRIPESVYGYYAADLKELQVLVGRDLSHWACK